MTAGRTTEIVQSPCLTCRRRDKTARIASQGSIGGEKVDSIAVEQALPGTALGFPNPEEELPIRRRLAKCALPHEVRATGCSLPPAKAATFHQDAAEARNPRPSAAAELSRKTRWSPWICLTAFAEGTWYTPVDEHPTNSNPISLVQ